MMAIKWEDIAMARHREVKIGGDATARAADIVRLMQLRQVDPRTGVAALAIATASVLRTWDDKDARANMLINFEELVLTALDGAEKANG